MVNGLCFIFLGTLGWGISLFLVKLLLVSLTPEDIIIYRMALGALFLFVLIKHQKIKTAQSGVLIKEGVVMGLMNIAIPFYLIVVAEKNCVQFIGVHHKWINPIIYISTRYDFLFIRTAVPFF